MSGNYPDGVTQEDIDRAAGGYEIPDTCSGCGGEPDNCECCVSCGATIGQIHDTSCPDWQPPVWTGELKPRKGKR